MKKIINAKEVTEIELKFNDENSLDIVFDTEAVSHLNDIEGGITSYINEKSVSERCAMIIFAGAKSKQPEFTHENARELVCRLSPATVTEIMNEFNESMGVNNNEVQKELQKKLMEQFLRMKK